MSSTSTAEPLAARPRQPFLDPADLAARWVQRRYRLALPMAAVVAVHAGLGGRWR